MSEEPAMASGRYKAVIVGAGVGGLAAAIGLQRADQDVLVFDRAPGWPQLHVGGGMQLGLNAMRGFQELGVREQVVAVGTPVLKQEVRSHKGTLLADWPVAALAQQYGFSDVRLVRSELHEALAGAVGEGVVRFAKALVGFAQDRNGVTVRFADGEEERGDVLIGADGLRSAVRAQLLGPSEPRYAGYAYWRGHTGAPHSSVREGESQLFMGPGTRFAYYAVGDRHVSWFSVANGPKGNKPISKGAILDRHRGWAHPVEEIIEATDESTIHYVDIVDRDPVDRWGEGRTTLLGDAAHPMTIDIAQGAGQAIEDAAVLVQCLAHGRDPQAALRAYEQRRIPRTSEVVRRARSMGKMFASDSTFKFRARSRFLQSGGSRLVWKRQEEMLTYDFLKDG